MKNLSGLIVVMLSVLMAVSCGSKSDKANPAATDSVQLPAEADTIIIGTDTVITAKTDSLAASVPSAPKSNAYIVVDKPNLKLYVIENNDTLFKGPICAGRNRGDKRAEDDGRTPEGTFKITHIHNATDWLYHANNGRWIPHVYGPWFLRLDAKGWRGIGIHGTSAPGQIGQRRSKGCIRLKNEDIRKVHDLAFVGMEVRVLPDVVKFDTGIKTTPKPSDTTEETGTPAEGQESESTVEAPAETGQQEAPAAEPTIGEPEKTEVPQPQPEKPEVPKPEPVKPEPEN